MELARFAAFVSLVVLVACSGNVGASATTDGGRGGSSHAPAGAGGALVPIAGHGGAGAGGAEVGGAGVGGGGGGAGMGGSAGGAAPSSARATLLDLQGSGVNGTVLFTPTGDHVKLELTLAACPAGPHAVHLHANGTCDDAGNAAGGHWSPQGEGIPDVTCAADGSGALTFDAARGIWSIGAPASSDLLVHAVMLHAGAGADPGARLACGVLAKMP